jgi:2-iminobutanoate/2-iminopropanoate deaminase
MRGNNFVFLKGFLHDGAELGKLLQQLCNCKSHFKAEHRRNSRGKTMKKVIQTENAPEPVGPYSQAVEVDKFLFVSGQVAIDHREGRIVANGIREQTARVMENIKAILQAAGYNLSDVVQSNVYLSSMALFSEFNTEYARVF